LISANKSRLSVTGSKGATDLLGRSPVFLENGDVLIARSQVTISDGETFICLGESPADRNEEYCIFEVNNLLSSITSFTDGCQETDVKTLPSECYPVLEGEEL